VGFLSVQKELSGTYMPSDSEESRISYRRSVWQGNWCLGKMGMRRLRVAKDLVSQGNRNEIKDFVLD
jgi:hypothetical protein